MNALTIAETANLTMSSREIATLCEKRHGDVIRDIRVMLEALGDDADLQHVQETKDSRGYTAEISLPKDLTLTLVAGYAENCADPPKRLDIPSFQATKQNKGNEMSQVVCADTRIFTFHLSDTVSFDVRSIVDGHGEPWFVASDVCAALGLGNVSAAISRLDPDESALISIEASSANGVRQTREVNAVNDL